MCELHYHQLLTERLWHWKRRQRNAELLSSSAFQTEREKVSIILPLDRKLLCSIVASWLPLGWRWDNFWVSAKCFSSPLPPSAVWFSQSGSGMPGSDDQWFLMEERPSAAWGFKRTEKRFCSFFWNQLWQSNLYDRSERVGVIPRICYARTFVFKGIVWHFKKCLFAWMTMKRLA